ncbi:MAG: S41 family peptidase [Bacteroidota bacterium]
MKKFLLITGSLLLLFTACKKSKPAEDTTGTTPPTTTPTTGTALDLMKDSVYLYAKEDYYWYDALPDYATVAPRAVTSTTDLLALQAVVNKISQYKINPATSLPYEYYSSSPGRAKYSYMDDGTSSQKLNATAGDFGCLPFYDSYNNNTTLYIKYVYTGSPADLAGVKRGYQVMSINGRTDLDANVAANLTFVSNAFSSGSSTITMLLKKFDNSTFTVTLNSATYTINPVITYKTIDLGSGKKMGYIVFNSFVSKASAQTALSNAFASFVTDGVTDLTVDLRYNGGGYVETSEYLAELIAPTSTSGKVMYTTYYSANLTAGNDPLLKNQVRRDASTNQLYNYSQIDFSTKATNFAKQGSLNINRVFFIVTGGTASASELTINSLRPYMNVQLIGRTTYGKPVGFFDINIGKYQMYIPEFETKNSLGQGAYYAGMAPGSTDYPGKLISDDVTKDFGDPTEKLLAQAINYAKNGVYTTSTDLQIQSVEGSSTQLTTDAINQTFNGSGFNGMIMKKYILKK